jgi:8-oxo-dGTP pyrophosphatase MutT (NUDIX family)
MLITEDRIANRLKAGLQATHLADEYAEIDFTEDTALKCAAVLIPLIREGQEWRVLYTRRTRGVQSHKGQVSFPGGGCDEGERTPEDTALREAHEEIGIDPSAVRILGRLSSLVTITGFRVTPVVGVVSWPTALRLNEQEVERVFTVPLSWLADDANRWEFALRDRGRRVVVFHPYDGELVWGATARMTVRFLETLAL